MMNVPAAGGGGEIFEVAALMTTTACFAGEPWLRLPSASLRHWPQPRPPAAAPWRLPKAAALLLLQPCGPTVGLAYLDGDLYRKLGASMEIGF